MCVFGDLSICPELGHPAVCQLREELMHRCVRGRHPQGAATRGLTTQGRADRQPTATGDIWLNFHISVRLELHLF